MYCPKCGTQVEDTEKFCPNCGGLIEAVETEVAHPIYDQFKKANVLATLSVIFGIVGIVAAWLFALAGYICGAASLVLAIVALKNDKFCSKAKVGRVLSFVALGCSLTSSIIGVILVLIQNSLA